MASALSGGWEEGTRALRQQILRSVLHNDFINNLDVATEDTLINHADNSKVKGMVGMFKGRLSAERTQMN